MLCPEIAILTPPPVWLSSFRKYQRSKENTLGCDTNRLTPVPKREKDKSRTSYGTPIVVFERKYISW